MQPPSTKPTTRWAALYCALSAAALTLVLWLARPDALRSLIDERGPVERLTEWAYFATAALFALLAPALRPRWTRAALVALMLGFGAREMDLHKAFTGTSVLKFGFYIGPAPWPVRLLAAFVVLAVAAALVWLVRRHAGDVWRGWRARRAEATSVVVFVAAMLLSKVLDRAPAILAEDHGFVLAPPTLLLVNGLEEIVELALPLIVAVAWMQHRRARTGR